MLYSDLSGVYVICLHMSMVFICWLVVSNMNFIFHFIYGMSSFPLTNIFQDCYYTTNQLWFLWIFRQRSPGPVRSPCPPCATQQSHAAAQPPKQPRNQQKEPSSHQSKQQQQPQEKPSSSRSNQPAPSTLLSTFLARPGAANICNLEPGAAPGAAGPIVLRLRHRPKHWQ